MDLERHLAEEARVVHGLDEAGVAGARGVLGDCDRVLLEGEAAVVLALGDALDDGRDEDLLLADLLARLLAARGADHLGGTDGTVDEDHALRAVVRREVVGTLRAVARVDDLAVGGIVALALDGHDEADDRGDQVRLHHHVAVVRVVADHGLLRSPMSFPEAGSRRSRTRCDEDLGSKTA